VSLHSRWLFPACVITLLTAFPLEAEQITGASVVAGDPTVQAFCTEGPTRVILLHGDDGGAQSWHRVLQHLSGRVGACAYERSALGPAPGSRSLGWFELLDRLQSVHAALGAEPGYILVGHGVGGLYARLFAADRPSALGGLVLVDPDHEDMPEAVVAGMPEAARRMWIEQLKEPNADGVREAGLAPHARAGRLPDIPVTVITAMKRRDGDGWDARFLRQAARRVHASMLLGVRQGRHIPADGSGHQVHLEAPDLVAGEISRMVRITAQRERRR
jgi:pimeloyl-ACP methyl ester carboxylesterase